MSDFKVRRYKSELPPLEMVLYYVLCIFSLGTLWAVKVIIKKAIAEAIQDKK